MLFIPIILLCLTITTSAFTFPKEALANGIYRAYYNDLGEEVHELVNSNPIEKEAASGSKVARGSPPSIDSYSWCGCGLSMNAGDTNVANDRLHGQISGGTTRIQKGTALYSVVNTAVAFICNLYPFDPNIYYTIDGNTVGDYAPRITSACGLYVPGTFIPFWDKSSELHYYHNYNYGYMNYSPGLDFCGASESSVWYYCP